MLLAMKTPALQRTLNNKPLTLKKIDKIDFRRYNRLRCSVPQPPKLYGLPKLHKPNIPMRPIVSFCGSPTYQLSKYLTNVLKPLTDESRHKLQSTEKFIDAIKTIQIPDDHKLVSFDVKSLFTSIPLQLALDCTENAINREFKIRRLRTTATNKHATAHDLNHVTVHFSRIPLRLRWVVGLFRVVGTTENILLVFCRFGNSTISSFRKKVFISPALSER